MKKSVIKTAEKKLKNLQKKCNGFINIVVDDWRGYRFVFDTKDVRKCDNDCKNCPLYQLVKDEPEGLFSAGLYKASAADKKLFGPQNFLNCKTLMQYQNCYINFLAKKAKTEKEIKKELNLIKNMKIIFSKNKDKNKLNKKFKKNIISETLKLSRGQKKKIVTKYSQKLKI